MRTFTLIVLITTAVVLALPAAAELQNVIVGGSLRIRGDWYTAPSQADDLTARNPLFQGPLTGSFKGVPGGNPDAGLRWAKEPGRLAVSGIFSWNDKTAHDWKVVEQRTTLNVRADFTEQVSAFIEFDSYNLWGDNFRSDYLTGIDSRGNANVSLYQAYIDVNQMFGEPLRLRVGRQELKFGSGWLVAPNDTAALFYGTSFDGVRATYATDQFSVDAFATKLVETSPLEGDGDVDFYGLYASYLGIKDITLDAYWLFLRDARSLTDTNYGWFGEAIEKWVGVDKYHPTNLHTVGLRGSGKYAALDFEAEVAYQFGDADAVGHQFAGAGVLSPYGPNGASFNNWGGNLEVGYTFDCFLKPRVYVGGAYLGGEDNRNVNFWGWLGSLVNPFWQPKASVSFNRLFSHWEYSEFLENTDLSNAWLARGGVQVFPTKATKVQLSLVHIESLSAYQAPWPSFFLFGQHFVNNQLSFLTKTNSKDMGYEAEIIGTYNYSEDLAFEAGYAHLFAGKGLREGDFSNFNGLGYNGGTADKDADYWYAETRLSF